ncbi:MAG: glycosyltransferase family 4 protein [Myxococcota bacterium]
MRVAVVIERFGAHGGVESAATHLVRELAQRGVEVTVIAREASGPPPDGAALETLRVSGVWQPLRLRGFSRGAARATRGRFDVVHSFSRTREQQIYRVGGGCHAAYMERVYRAPRLLRGLSPRHRAILAIEEAVFRDETQLIQCNARWVAEELRERYGIARERLVTIYNGVDTARFHPGTREARRTEILSELGVPGPLALFVGTGFQRKGLDLAIRGLAESGVEADLAVVGAGDPAPYRRRAAELGVARRVHFLGPRSDVATLYAAADLFVLPTRYDAFANACLEAMASGLAVATTSANGASELIEPGVNGLLCASDFSPAFAALRDLAGLAKLGCAARATAERFTWRAHADRVLELYARIRP